MSNGMDVRLYTFAKKSVVLFLMLCMAAGMMCFNRVRVCAAAPQYKVEFRAGAHGTIEGKSKYTVTVEYEGSLEGIPQPDSIDSGYWFTGYSAEIADTVTENTVYIAQYAKLINSVEYRINYIDTTGASVATQRIAYANEGETITAYAVAVDGYTADATTKAVTAQKSGTEITFIYSLPAAVPGIQPNAPAVQPAAADGIPAAQAAVVPAAPNAAQAAAAGQNAPGDGGNGDGAADNGLVAIDDENVPLANQDLANQDSGDGLQQIDDEEVPLANQQLKNQIPAWAYVASISIFAIIVLLAVIVFSKRYMAKKRK